MELHNVTQGSPEWLVLRSQYFTASEAPAMMGASPYMTRNELLAQKHTGLVAEVDGATQRRFDAGHETEAKFLPFAEEIIAEELFPVTGSIVLDGLRLLASFDGLTESRKIDYEHKLLSKRIVNAILLNGEPDAEHYWQLEQQLLVCDGEKALFVTSDGTKESATTCWYTSKPERRAALIAGWKQFAEDLKAYTPAAAPAPAVVAAPVQALPAVAVQVEGLIVVKDNFKTFETALRDFLEHRLIREPKTDQDFADLEVQIKAMKGAEEALAGAEAQMLAQVQSIDQAKKTKDMLAKLVRDNRLMAEKLLASEKDRRRGEIVAGGVAAFKTHIDGLNQRLGKNYMPAILADFGGAIKGMRSLTSMEDAVDTTLAKAKIAANEAADKIELNLKWLHEHAQDYVHLFADTNTLVLKPHDDFVAQAKNRIATEKARIQAERDRIREEEAAAARQKLIDEQTEREAQARKAQEAATPAPAVEPAAAVPVAETPAAPAPVVVTPVAAAIKVNPVPPIFDDGARIRLGQINEHIAPLSITADGLAELGFKHVATEKAAKLYRECDLIPIFQAMVDHISKFIVTDQAA